MPCGYATQAIRNNAARPKLASQMCNLFLNGPLAWAIMKLSRLFQPRNPLFWMMLALNALSAALAWIVQNRPLSAWVMLVVGGFAIANALIGTWLVWRLLRDGPGRPPESTR